MYPYSTGAPYQTQGAYPTAHPGMIPTGMRPGGPMPYGAPQPTGFAQTTATTTFQDRGWISMYYNLLQQQEIINLRAWFEAVDTDRSGTIEIRELQAMAFEGRPLGWEPASKLIKVFDRDRNGRLDFYEYCALHKFISAMRQAFIMADADRSGRIEAREIFQALQGAGFQYLTYQTILELLNKFDTTRQGLVWEQFLMMVCLIAHCRSLFEWNDKDRDGLITINSDQLVQLTAYLG